MKPTTEDSPVKRKGEALDEGCLDPPNPLIRDMYLEITNISQALNIALLVQALTDPFFYESLPDTYYSPPLFAVTSLIITAIFWARYYFDTHILSRSYSVFATLLFFAYGVAQGGIVSFVASPFRWLIATGVLLLLGFGFYAYNLVEIDRKQRAGELPAWPNFVQWQRRRMVELLVISLLTLAGAYLVFRFPHLALPAAVIAFVVAVWQAVVTADYRKLRFLRTGC